MVSPKIFSFGSSLDLDLSLSNCLGKEVKKQLLIEANNIELQVPVFHTADRRIMSNPMSFLTDLYFSKTRRGLVRLINGLDLKLYSGERLGIIGDNGAGKSTLLRLLAGIYQPTSGHLNLNGTVKGLFDISLGMLPEATGLENIYMRGLQMGLKLSEIRELLAHVIEFSELEEHIDKPINTYSTGMKLRLAFSISTMIEPDILLLDEWIGAGDANFREKVKERMEGLVEQSRGLVLATHNTGLMKRLCTHGLVLDKGSVVFSGDVEDALNFYEETCKVN